MAEVTADFLGTLPEAKTIRRRLEELRAEARTLRDLLTIAERRERQGNCDSAEEPAS